MDQRTNPKLIFQKMEHRIDSSDLEGVREKMKTMVEVRKKAVTEGVDCKIPVTEAWIRKHRLLYDGATRHPFIRSIRDGSVDFTSFKRWLVISPLFLLN